LSGLAGMWPRVPNVQKDLVSVLIPVYNREHIISETIDSALNQSYENTEIIIVDNNSSDGTWNVIQKYQKKFPKIKAFRNNDNIGPVRNWKKCIEMANGKYGKILWSDDLIDNLFIEKTIRLMSSNVGFVFSGAEIFSENINGVERCHFIGRTGIYKSKAYIEGSLYGSSMPVSPGCAIFRLADLRDNLLEEIPNKIGSIFSDHAIGNDLLIFLLTAKNYKYFGYIAEPLAKFRSHAGSITISARGVRIPLHYNIVKAYFVENSYKSGINKMACYLQIFVMKNRCLKTYGVHSVNDFFFEKYSLNYIFIMKLLASKLIEKILKR
jgi:glycosyltransferase involved in cell wall biosynthesis